MKRIALLILIAVVAISSADAQKVKRTKHKEEDGFKWYLIEQDGYQGAEIKKGTAVIPLEKKYNCIEYKGVGLFKVHTGNVEGIIRIDGQEIISTDCGYRFIAVEKIYDHTLKKYISYFLYVICPDDRSGLCNRNGKFIVPLDQHREFLRTDSEIYYGQLIVKYANVCEVIDTNGRKIISTDKGFDNIVNNTRYYVVYKDGKVGLYDLYGKEFYAPKLPKRTDDTGRAHAKFPGDEYGFYNIFDHDWDSEGIYYVYEDGIPRYLGVMVDKDGHGIPDPDHTEGQVSEWGMRYIHGSKKTSQTAELQQNAQYNTFNNSYQSTTQYNSPNNRSNTTPQNNTTQNREKCKYCMGSGRCQGLNSPGGTRTIKMHCNGSGRCSTCGGKGLMSDGFGHQTKCSDCSYTGKCRFCKGTGKCDRCGGTGYR